MSGLRADDAGRRRRERAARRGRASASPAGSGAPLAGLAVRRSPRCWSSRWSSAAIWLVFFSVRARREAGRGRGHRPARRRDQVLAPAARPRRASRWPGSTSTPIRARVGRWPPCASVDVTRQWPDSVADRRRGAGRRSRSSRSAAGCAAWTPRAWSSATTTRRRPGLPRVETAVGTTPRGARARPRPWSSALPERPRRAWSTTSRSLTVDQITLVLRDGRTCVWGSAEESDAQGRGARRAARAAGPGATTSASPASPPPD